MQHPPKLWLKNSRAHSGSVTHYLSLSLCRTENYKILLTRVRQKDDAAPFARGEQYSRPISLALFSCTKPNFFAPALSWEKERKRDKKRAIERTRHGRVTKLGRTAGLIKRRGGNVFGEGGRRKSALIIWLSRGGVSWVAERKIPRTDGGFMEVRPRTRVTQRAGLYIFV